MLHTQQEALAYVATHEEFLLAQLDDYEVRTVYQRDDGKIKVMREGNHLLKITHSYGSEALAGVFIDMMDNQLFT